MIPTTNHKGKAWAKVVKMDTKEVVHSVETQASTIDRVISGMLRNMNTDAYYVDEWYEFPEKGEKDADGKVRR